MNSMEGCFGGVTSAIDGLPLNDNILGIGAAIVSIGALAGGLALGVALSVGYSHAYALDAASQVLLQLHGIYSRVIHGPPPPTAMLQAQG